MLQGVNLQVQPGETVVLTGGSGSGKSTLLHAIAGLLPHRTNATVEGTVQVAGRTLPTAPDWVARHVGIVHQRPEDQLLHLDVLSEVTFKPRTLGEAPEAARDRAREALKSLGAGHLSHREVPTLSGGEAQRVALAAALATTPQVLLLDEPLASLDAAGARKLLTLLAEGPRERALVVATHRPHRYRDLQPRVLKLRQGKLQEGHAPTPTAPEPLPPTPTQGTTLELHHVHAGPDGAEVLQDITATLGPGLVAIAGPNGAGKTTLLRTLAGLLEPTAGHVRADGTDLHGLTPPERARRVGYAPQDPTVLLFHPTVEEEITYGPRNLDVPVDPREIADRLGLAPLLPRSPHAVSGGEAERIAWAAAHAHDPPIQLYDEPTRGLDAHAREALRHRLARHRAGGGLALVATHDPGILRLADTVLHLREGRVTAHGPPEGLLPLEPAPEVAPCTS